jgi:hypothetical protein
MRPSKWLVFIRPALAGFDRPLTALEVRRAVWNGAGYVRPLLQQGEQRPSSNQDSFGRRCTTSPAQPGGVFTGSVGCTPQIFFQQPGSPSEAG